MEQGTDRSPVLTYAARLARLWLLSVNLPQGHPVLDIEEELVGMAASECREHLLKSMPLGQLREDRAVVESWIVGLVAGEARRRRLDPSDIPGHIVERIGDLFRSRSAWT